MDEVGDDVGEAVGETVGPPPVGVNVVGETVGPPPPSNCPYLSEYFRLLRWHIRHENPINKGNYNYLLFSLSEITKKLFVSFLCENDFFMFCFYLELLSPGSNSSHKSRFIHDSNSVNTFTNILQSTLFTNRITR